MIRNFKYYLFLFFFLWFFFVFSQKDTENSSIICKDSVYTFKKNGELKKEMDSVYRSLYLKGCYNTSVKKYMVKDSLQLLVFTSKNKIRKFKIKKKPESLEFRLITQLIDSKLSDAYFELHPNHFENFMNKLISLYIKEGYPFVKIKNSEIKIIKDVAYITLNVDLQQKRYIDSFVIKGYEKFPLKFLRKFTSKKRKTIYNEINTKKIARYLHTLPFISPIKEPEILFKKDSTIMYLYLKKVKSNLFDGLIGFSNASNTKFNINGYLQLSLNNIFDKGNSFKLNWNNNGEGTSTLNLFHRAPYLFQTSFANQMEFQLLKRDSLHLNTSLKEEISFAIQDFHRISVLYNYEASNTLLKTPQSDFKKYTKNFIGIGYEYKKPSFSVYEPWKFGVKSMYQNGNKKETDGNNEVQQIYSVAFFYNYPFNNRFFIKLGSTFKKLQAKKYLQNELFALGGSDSLRGFKDSSVFASEYFITNLDLVLYQNRNVGFSFISDFAQLTNMEKTNNIYSVGLGYEFKIKKDVLLNLNYIVTKQNRASFNKGVLRIGMAALF